MTIFSPEWFSALLAIILIDILIGGDNAVIIALAAKSLPKHLQKKVVIFGTIGAIAIRFLFAFFLIQLLAIEGIRIVGGILLIIIAIKLTATPPNQPHTVAPATSLIGAIVNIVVADTVMSLDNVLAIAGAARGDVSLVIIGLLISIPIIMKCSLLILNCLERWPWIVIAGGVLLIGVSARMILDDPPLQRILTDTMLAQATAQWMLIIIASGVFALAASWYYRRSRRVGS